MNLISCDDCGVVLDKDKINFPTELWDDDEGAYDLAKSEWSSFSGRYVAKVSCPVCKGDILDE